VLHRNGLGLSLGLCLSLLLLLHLLLLLAMVLRCLGLHQSCCVLRPALLLVLHLLLLLLELEVWRKIDKATLTHLSSHCLHLLWSHVLHVVLETHAHAAASLLGKHSRLLLLAHVSLLLSISLLLYHGRIHCSQVSRCPCGSTRTTHSCQGVDAVAHTSAPVGAADATAREHSALPYPVACPS